MSDLEPIPLSTITPGAEVASGDGFPMHDASAGATRLVDFDAIVAALEVLFAPATVEAALAAEIVNRIADVDAETAARISGLAGKQGSHAHLTTISGLSSVANLSALANLSGVADRLAYFTGAGALSLATLSSFARTLLDDGDAATMRATLGITAGGADHTLPTGALAQTMPRHLAASGNQSNLTSGTMQLHAVGLTAGQSISSITFVRGGNALVAATAQWFGIYSAALAKLAVTADDGATAWASQSPKTLAITGGPYVVPSTGLYYLAINVTAGTPGNLRGLTQENAVSGIAPLLSGASTAGLGAVGTAPANAAAPSTPTFYAYAYVS